MVVDTAYYELLDVPPDAPQAKIKQKYRKLAFELHPDRNPGDVTAKEKFQALSEAYEVISDPDRRVVYDKYGKEQAKPDNGFSRDLEIACVLQE
ncbi:MAG: hypothetical protein M1820_008786 [Bogoriella megaspora]|nr:MAG: hypothetical protein M1820_008786 [Bogoriella megaspora]